MKHALSIGMILERLASASVRPRYSFLVLTLIAEAASEKGEAGPFVLDGDKALPIRDWLCRRLLPLTGREDRRTELNKRVALKVADKLTGDQAVDEEILSDALTEEAVRVGKANVSRAVTELVNAELLTRYYAGRVKHHAKRGGRRTAVYVIKPDVLAALRTRNQLI